MSSRAPIESSTVVQHSHWTPRQEPRWAPLPDSYLALERNYEQRTTLFPGWRELLVDRLALRRGDTVIDVSCGTGLNLGALHDAVGPSGTIIAVDPSPELLAIAAHRVARRRWDNVELINAPVNTANLSVRADAALLCAAHDVITSPAAMSNLISQLRVGAAVAAGGWKSPSRWLWPLRAAVTALAGPFVTALTELDQPQRLLGDYLSGLQITQLGFGVSYLAHGHTAE